jgi:tetratricopeptide (TPR) repeat protein
MHIESKYGGARGGNWELPILDRILVAGRALWFYVGKLLWPAELVPIYPRWRISSAEWWQYSYPLAAAATLIGLWCVRARLGRGPAVAAACFAVLLGPLVGIFNVSYHLNSYVADHFQHHGAPALIALFAAGAAALCRRLPRPGFVAPLAGFLLLALLTLLSARYTRVFQNEEARCRDTLVKNPAAWVAMNNLGVALNARGEPREAIEWYERAIRARSPYPEAHNNLGVALVALGDLSESLAHYEQALRDWPGYPKAHNNLGTALARLGRIEEAVKQYEEALRLEPDYAEARENLVKLLVAGAARGDASQAALGYANAIRLKPDSAEAHNGLGMALARVGKFNEAIREFEVSVRLRPDYAEARNNLGTALSSTGNYSGAIAQYTEAIRIQPGYAEAHGNLGMALLSAQRPGEAVAHFEAALGANAGDAGTHAALGVALAETGRLDQAIVEFERALEIDPANTDARFNLDRARGMNRSPRKP